MDSEVFGICVTCQLPVVAGQPRYTGGERRDRYEHWDCHEKNVVSLEDLDRAFERLFGTVEKAVATGVFRPARAKGGYRYHLVDTGSHVSLCGHRPQNTGRMQRAGWAWRDALPEHGQWCPHCRERKEANEKESR